MIKTIKNKKPLIHCITNPISINHCANAVLALGARPIMAEHPDEVSEITSVSDALLLNLGNITESRIRAIEISSKTVGSKNIPFIIDAVGVSCSKLRRELFFDILKTSKPRVIKGNYSEILALYDRDYKSRGVDSESLDEDFLGKVACELSKKYNAVILASGKTDIIADAKKLCYIKNGTKQLSSVTGTGCMLGAITAVFLSAFDGFSASREASLVLGICGELSNTDRGSGSFMINLMDNLSNITDECIKNNTREELKNV